VQTISQVRPPVVQPDTEFQKIGISGATAGNVSAAASVPAVRPDVYRAAAFNQLKVCNAKFHTLEQCRADHIVERDSRFTDISDAQWGKCFRGAI
jgi:hypothetical protein